RGQRRHFNGRACRAWFAGAGEIFGVEFVVGWEIFFHVSEKDRDINNVVPIRACVLQYEPDIVENSAALFLDVVTRDLAGRIECDSGDFLAPTRARSDS